MPAEHPPGAITAQPGQGALVLLSVALMALVLGSLHAFSVFLEPLETRFAAGRGPVSLTYSLALTTLTLSVLSGHRVFPLLRPAPLILVICIVAAAGAGVAANATSLPLVWFGYSLLFGGANGLGYGFGLQIAAQANPRHEGAAMGAVTAAYAAGATVAPAPLTWAIATGGIQAAMSGLALALLVVAPVSARLIAQSGIAFRAAAGVRRAALPTGRMALLWLGYGAAVAAGLMAIGHAAGIARSLGLDGRLWLAPMLIALCNMCGSFAGGGLADRIAPGRLLTGLPLASVIFLLALAMSGDMRLAFICLGGVGFTYGAIIAAYPAAISKRFGAEDSTRAYGRVFTAWGAAGLLAPWLAGTLFDRTGGYSAALFVAAALGLISAAAITGLDRQEPW